MATIFDKIDSKLSQWILAQKIFFTASAPLSSDGHINCSPKGLDTFRVLDEHTVAYQDLVGSGAETIAHIQENKRLIIMFCAFDGPPRIVRLHGKAEFISKGHPMFEEIEKQFNTMNGTRGFILLNINRISDSCGYAVPIYDFKKDRDTLHKWVANKGEDGIKNYIVEKNNTSIDGLPAIN